MWKDKYELGVERIDEQHKELFDRLSNFIRVVQNENEWDEKIDEVKETLNFLQEYVVYHFDDEEEFQEKINYPDIENHKKEHARFKQGINDYVDLFDQGGFTEEKIQELSARVMTWLIMHVGKIDQKLGEYARSLEVDA